MGEAKSRVLEFTASDEIIAGWAEVGGALLVELNARGHALGATHFVVKDLDERVVLQGEIYEPLLSESDLNLCERIPEKQIKPLVGSLAEDVLLPESSTLPFGLKKACVLDKSLALRSAQGNHGMVLRMWVRTLSGDRAKAFVNDGAGIKKAAILRQMSTSVARKAASLYGCDAYGLFDESSGLLLAFEKAVSSQATWAARYEVETGREVVRKRSKEEAGV